MNGLKISDRISTKTILEKLGCLSVNQLNAQIKLLDVWKANNVDSYPTKMEKWSAMRPDLLLVPLLVEN